MSVGVCDKRCASLLGFQSLTPLKEDLAAMLFSNVDFFDSQFV